MSEGTIFALAFIGVISCAWVIGSYGGDNGWSFERCFIATTAAICLFCLLAGASA